MDFFTKLGAVVDGIVDVFARRLVADDRIPSGCIGWTPKLGGPVFVYRLNAPAGAGLEKILPARLPLALPPPTCHDCGEPQAPGYLVPAYRAYATGIGNDSRVVRVCKACRMRDEQRDALAEEPERIMDQIKFGQCVWIGKL